MQALLRFAGLVDRISRVFGIVAAILVFLGCMISAGNALSRYALDMSSNAWLEVQWQIFAGIFLLGAPWVLKLNEHVRVDLIYGGLSDRGKLWVDVFGILFFLFPTTLVMIAMSIPWFLKSFADGETSANAGGILVWPVKGILPLGFSLLALQGLAELIKRVAALRGDVILDIHYEKPVQ